MTTPQDGLTIHDYVNELTQPHDHREPVKAVRRGGETWTNHHVTRVPSLVHQLLLATPTKADDSGGSGGYKSRPAAHLEGLDTLILIDLQAGRWVRDLGEVDPVDKVDEETGMTIRGSGTIACLLLLHGLWASADLVTQRAIERDVRRWWTQARIVSGWDSAAWRPNNTCPACGRRGGLRVRLSVSSAVCIACHATWDSSTIGLLAEHIRTEDAEAC